MELYEASGYYIIQDGEYSLWCNRHTGAIEAKSGDELCNAWNPVCLGMVYGVLGKIQVLPDTDWRLVLIKQKEFVGYYLDNHQVYRVGKVAILPISTNPPPSDLELAPCKKHHFGISKPKQITQQSKQIFQSTLNSIKSVKDSMQSKKTTRDPQKEQDRLEKKILEELAKMFNLSEFYYFSPTGDLTNTIQRQNLPSYNRSDPLWKRADERFFWNKSLLLDLITSNDPLSDHWIQPIIQGYFDVKPCSMTESSFYQQSMFHEDIYKFSLALVSRRSRHRAGTRYKRRGVDTAGDCANYVETEQILGFQEHLVSYVQVRGSIPVFWSQPGHKYRPPPILDKGEKETQEAFDVHFQQQFKLYNHVTCISLVDRQGREKVMSDAFLHHVVLYNNPSLAFVAFDFHDYCRGMQFDNIIMLTDAIKEMLRAHKYCWVDQKGMICEQRGVFRVNCIDCLDRTNVVQTAVARIILDQQVRKLGLLTPDFELPESVGQVFNQLWANNGDAISRQYAGTAAMKGDYTRTGERKFSGLMKDGVKSANRYLIQRFKDLYRQAAIDIQVGQPLDPDVYTTLSRGQQDSDSKQDEMEYIREKASDIVSVIDEGRTLLIIEPEQCLGGWGVITMDDGDIDDEMDAIILLTNSNYYIVNYDDDLDCLTHYQKIPLSDLYAIDIGALNGSVFRSRQQCIRFWYRFYGEAGYFHTFKVPNVRAFNNTVIEIKSEDEVKEILRAIADAFKAASEISQCLVNIRETKIENKRFRPVARTSIQRPSLQSSIWSQPHSFASLASNAVNKAASNVKKQVTNQFKKLQISPRHSSNKTGQINPAHQADDNMELFDDFSDQYDTPMKSVAETADSPSQGASSNIVDTRARTSAVFSGKTRNVSLGSMPDLTVSEDISDTLDVKQTSLHISRSSPHILVEDLEKVEPIEESHSKSNLANQTHHSTAPCLHDLDNSMEGQPADHDMSQSGQLQNGSATSNMKISFSDDGLKTYAVVLPDTEPSSRSPFSKIRSGLSQVSQLIVNPSASPHARRRRQILEAQLLDNHMKSGERFKNLNTKILLL